MTPTDTSAGRPASRSSRTTSFTRTPARPKLMNALAQQARQMKGAKILCGVPAYNNGATIGHVVRALEAGLRIHFPDVPSIIVISDGGSGDDTVDAALNATTEEDEDLLLIDPKAERPQRVVVRYRGISGKGSAFRALFTLAEMAEIGTCAVFDADLRSVAPTWVNHLVGPVLHRDQDFVAPVYTRHKHDGTITNAIAFPLTAALYGHRLRQPIGGDFGFSGKLAAHWAAQDVWGTDVARYGVDIWMTTTALTNSFRICQAQLGAKIHDPKDPGADLGPMFRQVVGSLFALAGESVDRWWPVDELLPVNTYGFSAVSSAEAVRVRAGRLMWRFVEGSMRYERVWRKALAPETHASIMHATGEAAERTEGFAISPDLWVRIVYDYLVAFNARVQPDARLLDSMIPLFFARTATFVQETMEEDQDAAEARVARLADLFVEQKDYLRRRWAQAGVSRTLDEQVVTPVGEEPIESVADVLGHQTD